MPSSPKPAARPPRHPLAVGAFRAYLVVRLASVLAQNAMTLIIGWQAYNIARETMSAPAAAAQLGIIGLIQFVVLFLLTPFSGLAADRLNRRVLAMATLLLQAISAFVLMLGTIEGWIGLPLIFSVAALIGIARAFSGPAMGAIAPNIVPRELLPRAIALSSMIWQAGTIIGPALGGYAYAAQDYLGYGASVFAFLLALGALALVGHVPQSPPDRTRRPIGQILDGLHFVRRNRLVQATITLDLFAVLLAGTTALLPVYARDILHVGAAGLGHLAAAPGAGAAAMALLFSIRPISRNVGVKMLASVIIFGLATICFGATAFMAPAIQMPVALAAMACWGAADMVSVFVRQTLIQVYTPDEMRGRVGSVSQLTISASNELGEAESGFLAALVGPVAAVIAGGVGSILITLLWIRLYPELRLARTFDPPDLGRGRSDPKGEAA